MSEKKDPQLADELPLKDTESGILLKWDRESGNFHIFFDGPPLHISSLSFLMETATQAMHACTNNSGMVVSSLPIDEQEQYNDEMPINNMEDDQEETEEDKNVPPWLKGN